MVGCHLILVVRSSRLRIGAEELHFVLVETSMDA